MFKYQILDDSNQKQYVAKNRPGVKAYADHIKNGQRKLFIMELLFLKKFQHLSKTIIYAGASPGHHLYQLIPLYPNHTWILYDPIEIQIDTYDPILREIDIIIVQKCMTIDEAERHAVNSALFISDIRSLNQKDGPRTEINKANKVVKQDMELQKACVEKGRFIASSLKFRLPWIPGQTEYFKGELFVQPWTGEHSPELRLFVKSEPNEIPICGQVNIYKKYDHVVIDNQMFYHNTVVRRKGHFDDDYDEWVMRLPPVYQ